MNAMNFDQNKISELATIIQPADDDDELRFLVEPRHLENSQGNLLGSLDSQFFTPDRLESDRGGYLEMSANDECKELLELAAHGGIQFVHATEDETDEVGTVDAPSFHGFSDSFIFGAENQIMVLNSSDVSQKINMSDDVQVLDNKEIRILGRKQPDEPQLPDMTFLSQPIDFACPKNSDFLDNNELDYVCENS
ncbi:uncharacterized protein [Prorops nasuta]|uniref:uncharacterized protein n=1 Tax=Prorops nasuta TaxID=863751 RepID=UPI0034CE3CB8